MRALAFSKRNIKEILRDPLSFIFGLGFPVILIVLISVIQQSIPEMSAYGLYAIDSFAPAMAVFGLSFVSLFMGMLISGDRSKSYLMRLFATPMKVTDYIVGYSLPMLPLGIAQTAICFIAAVFFGMNISINILLSIVVLIPSALLFIAIGMFVGTAFMGAQVGGIGSIIINIAAFLSGAWFPLDIIKGTFKNICYALPFAHSVDAARHALSGSGDIIVHLLVVLAYTAVIFIAAVLLFKKKMKG